MSFGSFLFFFHIACGYENYCNAAFPLTFVQWKLDIKEIWAPFHKLKRQRQVPRTASNSHLQRQF